MLSTGFDKKISKQVEKKWKTDCGLKYRTISACFVYPDERFAPLLDEFDDLLDTYQSGEMNDKRYITELNRLIRQEPDFIDLHAHLSFAFLEQEISEGASRGRAGRPLAVPAALSRARWRSRPPPWPTLTPLRGGNKKVSTNSTIILVTRADHCLIPHGIHQQRRLTLPVFQPSRQQ